MCAYTKMRRVCGLSVRCGGAGVTAVVDVLLFFVFCRTQSLCVFIALGVGSVPGAARSCRCSLAMVLDGRRSPSPTWRLMWQCLAMVVVVAIKIIIDIGGLVDVGVNVVITVVVAIRLDLMSG